ncbi:MAG: ABC transporter permease [Rhodothermales bacterium]
MGVFEAFRMAWESLRSNKLRSSLTLLGMVIGVFAIMTSVTAVEVIDTYFKDRINFLGSSTFSIARYPGIRTGDGQRYRNRRPITIDQVDRLKEALTLPVDISVREDFSFGKVEFDDKETEPNTVLYGSDENFLGNYSFELAEGRFLTDQDVHYARPVVVLGSIVAEELFPMQTPLGKTVQMGGQRYQVIGVLEEKGSFLGWNQDRILIAPISYLMGVYGGGNSRNIASISVRARSVNQVPAVMDEIISRFRVIRKVPAGEDNDFELESNNTMQGFFDAFTGTLTIGGAGIGLIALLAAGIGIMNIMLVSVTERTREIGIRKSIGAKKRDIVRQFLLEAFFLCQIGGVIGLMLGAGVGNAVALYFEISAAIPWDWAIGGVVAVTVIALVFGGYPAFKAAGLDPIESLRYE